MTHKFRLITLIVIIAALAAACGGRATPEAAPPAPTAKSAAIATSPTEPADAAVAATPQGPQASTEGDELSVSDRETGLEKLDSYRATWQLQWDSTGSDQPQSIMWEWMQEYTRTPKAAHWRWQMQDGSEEAAVQAMEFWQLDKTTYIVTTNPDGEVSCISSTSEDASVDNNPMGPQSLGSVDGAKFVGVETVNGIRARHYRYDEKSMALVGGGRVSGDIWVAVDGGYVVKDAATWEGKLFGVLGSDKASGAGSWTWELTDVNGAIAIVAPAMCESAAGELPVLPDATERASFGDMLTYKTATKQADVIQFYRDAMKKAGWAEEGETMVTEQFASVTSAKMAPQPT